MAESHLFPSAAGAQRVDSGLHAGHDGDEHALGFECADPCLQIESWAAEHAGLGAGNAESAPRPS